MTDPNPPVPPTPPATDGVDWQKEAEKWKALSRKHEDQSKQNKAELEKLAAAGDATKSDMDKVLAELAAMRQRSQEAERRALLAEVAGKTGLSMAKVSRLNGETVDDLLADAGEVFEWKAKTEDDSGGDGGKPTAQPPTGRPRPTLTPSPNPAGAPPVEETDPMKLAALVPRS